jgi:hypothetical protein
MRLANAPKRAFWFNARTLGFLKKSIANKRQIAIRFQTNMLILANQISTTTDFGVEFHISETQTKQLLTRVRS